MISHILDDVRSDEIIIHPTSTCRELIVPKSALVLKRPAKEGQQQGEIGSIAGNYPIFITPSSDNFIILHSLAPEQTHHLLLIYRGNSGLESLERPGDTMC